MNSPLRIGPFEYVEHAPAYPELIDGRDAARQRVVIAGGGPVGLATALALARWGIASLILEADTTVCNGSRAICVSRRSLEIIEQLGALAPHLAKGLPWKGGRSFHGLDQFLHFTMPGDENQKLPPMINIQQYWIEQFLVDAAQRAGEMIEIRWGTELVGFEQEDGGLTLRARTTESARAQATEYGIATDWLIACDGGQSFVRKSLGLKLEGTGFDGKYVIVDIELASPYPTERRAWFDPPSNPGSTVLMHKQPDDVWRVDYQIPDDADLEEAMKPANAAAFVQRHLDMIGEGDLPWKIVWISAYRAGAMSLERYRHARILFAGNAAHAMPIFGVRGLNSGFDDAYNLAWKLASVLRGWSDDTLLASYDDERLHAYRVNAASAIQSTEFMAPPSRGFSLMREAALTLARRHPRIAELANPRQTSVIAYDHSPLNLPSDEFETGPKPGDALPECPIRGASGNAYLSDLMGPHWSVLIFANDVAIDRRLDAILREWGDDRVPIRSFVIATDDSGRATHADVGGRAAIVDDGERAAQIYGALNGAVYLVRPDGHVAGRWRRQDAPELLAALERLGAAPSQ